MNDADANTNRHNNNTQFGLVDAIRKKAPFGALFISSSLAYSL
jgi:hypothetical protein